MVVKMGIATVEERGRVLIPKEIRDELGLHGGGKLRIAVEDGRIVMRPLRDKDALRTLNGCVDGGPDPLDVKEIWQT